MTVLLKKNESPDTAGSGGISRETNGDKLVEVIFAAIKKESASPIDRMRAIYRAGRIAEVYSSFQSDEHLMEAVFGSTPHDMLQDDMDDGHDTRS